MNAPAALVPNLAVAGAIVGGKYRLVERLGEGGIAEVWEAVNVDLDAPVAVKLCRPHTSDEGSLRRLIQEAKAAARLMHPSIVRVYDTGLTEQGLPYVVMERLMGKTLRAEIDRTGPIDLLYIVNTMIAVLDALALAHRHGIIHRDVKPDNIFLTEVDAGRVQPKLLDFGIIKIQGAEFNVHLTKTGTTLGSPAYMSPEHAAGREDVDERTDIWSACVVLFEAMIGRMPFEGPNYNALMRCILTEPVPDIRSLLLASNELTPFSEAVARTVQRGLSKEREQRWPSAEALRDALSDCVSMALPSESGSQSRLSAYHLVRTSTSPAAAPTVAQWISGVHAGGTTTVSSWRVALGVLAVALVGGGLALWLVLQPSGVDPAHRAVVTPPREEPATTTVSAISAAASRAELSTAVVVDQVVTPVAAPAPSSTAPSSTAPSSTAPSSTAPSSTAPSRLRAVKRGSSSPAPGASKTDSRKGAPGGALEKAETTGQPSGNFGGKSPEPTKPFDDLGLKEAY